jgi:hypothetical protein
MALKDTLREHSHPVGDGARLFVGYLSTAEAKECGIEIDATENFSSTRVLCAVAVSDDGEIRRSARMRPSRHDVNGSSINWERRVRRGRRQLGI